MMKKILWICICALLVLPLFGCSGEKKVPSVISWKPEDSSFIDEKHMLRISAHYVQGTQYREGPYIIVSLPSHLQNGFKEFSNTSSETVDLSPTQINEIVIRAGIDPGNALKLDSLRAQKMECDQAAQSCVSRLQFSLDVLSDQFLPGKENSLQVYLIVFDEEAVATQAIEVLPASMGKK